MGRGLRFPFPFLKYLLFPVLLVLLGLNGPARAEDSPGSVPKSTTPASQAPKDATANRAMDSTTTDALVDTALAASPKSRTDSVIVVKHGFEHREQIITGSVIMTCLMLMMVAMNNYNPR